MKRRAIRGIGVEGICSEIGAVGREDLYCNKEQLIEHAMHRFQAERWEVEESIYEANLVNAVWEKDGMIGVVLEK